MMRSAKRVVGVSSSGSSSMAFRSSGTARRKTRPEAVTTGHTFESSELDVARDELDDPVGGGDALLHGEDAGEHAEKDLLELALSGELEALSVLDGLRDGGGIGVEFVEGNNIFVVVSGGRLRLVKYLGDSSVERF